VLGAAPERLAISGRPLRGLLGEGIGHGARVVRGRGSAEGRRRCVEGAWDEHCGRGSWTREAGGCEPGCRSESCGGSCRGEGGWYTGCGAHLDGQRWFETEMVLYPDSWMFLF
jgi:hypothetical protein